MKRDAKSIGLELAEGEEPVGWMRYPIPDKVKISTRMQLSREQVEGMVSRLQSWLKKGEFVASPLP